MTGHWLVLAAELGVAAVFGGMLFFAAVFAPQVFRHLPRETAGPFMRQVFPAYYLTMGAFSRMAGVMLTTVRPVDGALMIAVAAGFIATRQILLPRINRQRDPGLENDALVHRRRRRLHRFSVWLNLVQLVPVAAVLARLAT